MKTAIVSRPPCARARVSTPWLAVAAALSIALWLAVELLVHRPIEKHYAEMLMAARAMQAASDVLLAEKIARGLMPPTDADPNRTGMIGQEYTPITTTLGDLASKRTATNPDLAAALLRLIATLDLPRGTPVVIVLSGSFVGANVATLAAVETLGLRPIVIVSLSASMWGANDPQFNWLDMAALLRKHGVIDSRTTAAVLGGDGAVGGGIEAESVAMLRGSAARDDVPIIEARPLPALIDALIGRIDQALGEGMRAGAVINVGGALIGLGTCRESYEFPPGLTLRGATCTAGTPGLAVRLSQQGLPLLHVLNLRRLALELGLPFDPMPLPIPGNNPAVYGAAPKR